MPKIVDLIGQRFNKFVVLEKKNKDKFGNICWLCQCDCGNEKILSGNALKNKNTKSCGCIKNAKDLSGEKFGYLVVLERVEVDEVKSHDGKYIFWLCKCICGASKIIRGDSLRNNVTSSCGCLHPRKPHTDPATPRISSAKNIYRNVYHDGNLTFDEFYQLSQQNCHYCGAKPTNKFNLFKRGKNQRNSSQFSKDHGDFIYNGLDRIDSSLPHDKNNVVTCCYPCNWSKSNRTVQEFESWIMRAAINLYQRNNEKKQELLNRFDANNLI
jgi:hypothetical protein